MEQMHVVQRQVVKHVHQISIVIVQHDQVAVVAVHHDSSQIQVNVAVKHHEKQNIVVMHEHI